MQRISYTIMAITLYIILAGCGLVAFPSKEIPKENQQTTQKNQQDTQKNMLRLSDKSPNQSMEMVMKKNDKTYIHTIQEKIITVVNQDKHKPPISIVVPIKVDPVSESPDNDPTPVPSEPSKEEEPPPSENGEETSQQDKKYQAAMKKAEELKGTDQQVTADQGNVYENPEEKSNIIQTILKDQKLHIGNTKVDKDDAEIWCYVSGNDGQKDIIGWISYQIIEQR